MSNAALLAVVSGCAGALALRDLVGGGVVTRGAGAARGLAALVDAVVALGREGRDPGAVERRRLLLAGASLAFALGAFFAGAAAGLALAAGGALGGGARPARAARALPACRGFRGAGHRAGRCRRPGRRPLAAQCTGRGHACSRRRRRARAAPRRRGTGRRRAHRAGTRGDAFPRALVAARHGRGRLPAAAQRGRRPRPPPARQRAGDGGELAARG